MRARGFFVQLMGWYGTVAFSLEKEVESFFLIFAHIKGQTLDMNLTFCIVLNRDGCSLLLWSRHGRNEIKHKFIVDFEIWNSHGIFIIETTANLLEYLWNGTRNEASVFVILHASAHSKCLTGSCLSIHQNCAVETVYNRSDYITCAVIENVVLAGIVQDLVEFKSPRLLLIVDHSTMFILRDVYIDMLKTYINNINMLHSNHYLFRGSLMRSWLLALF